MRVKKLRLENFRIHRDSELNFGDSSFIVVRGRNWSGKTTIGQALSICLTPSTIGLDAQGRGFVAKIRRGESKAVITADLQAKHYLIQRTVTLNTNTSGRTQQSICLSDPDWNPAPFDKKLESSRAALTVALNTDAFLRMDEKDQKNLLAGLALPARYDFSPLLIAEVETVLGKGEVNFEGEPFAAINTAYKKLFDERTVVNRQVREFVVPDPLRVPAGVDSYQLQEQLTTLRGLRRDREKVRTDAVAAASREQASRDNLKAKAEEATDNERKQENAIRAKLLSEGKLAYLTKIAAGKPELERLHKEHAKFLPLRESHRAQLASLEGVQSSATKCPTCEQSIQPGSLSLLRQKVLSWLEDASSAVTRIEEQSKALGDVGAAVELVNRHQKALKELEAFEAGAEERQKARGAKAATSEPVLFDFAPYDQSIAEIDTEIELVTTMLRPAIAAEERTKEIAIRTEQFGVLKERAAMIDNLVKYFDKDGIKAKLIGEYIGGFECKLNEVMDAWGYSCALSIEPYSFEITNARKDVIPVRELSGAERIMFSLAFQCAVARTAGIGLVVIDEVAMLLPELRPVLNKRLWEMIRDGFLEQVILLVADTSESVPNLPRAAFFMVTDGAVYPLVAQQASR